MKLFELNPGDRFYFLACAKTKIPVYEVVEHQGKNTIIRLPLSGNGKWPHNGVERPEWNGREVVRIFEAPKPEILSEADLEGRYQEG